MKLFTLAVAIVALATVGAASGSTQAPTAHNPRTFPDPTGDSAGGPDITSVLVGNKAAGLIRFEVSIANTLLLSEDDAVLLFIDADRSSTTGVFEGFEYTIQTAGSLGELVLARWDGSQFVRVAAPSLVKVWESGGKMTFRIARADLGNTQGFSFFAATRRSRPRTRSTTARRTGSRASATRFPRRTSRPSGQASRRPHRGRDGRSGSRACE